MDEIAKLYITDSGHSYRIKVFDHAIGIECQQPHGDNRFYDRTEPHIYDGHSWNLEAIGSLIAEYERDQHDQTAAVTSAAISQLQKLADQAANRATNADPNESAYWKGARFGLETAIAELKAAADMPAEVKQ